MWWSASIFPDIASVFVMNYSMLSRSYAQIKHFVKNSCCRQPVKSKFEKSLRMTAGFWSWLRLLAFLRSCFNSDCTIYSDVFSIVNSCISFNVDEVWYAYHGRLESLNTLLLLNICLNVQLRGWMLFTRWSRNRSSWWSVWLIYGMGNVWSSALGWPHPTNYRLMWTRIHCWSWLTACY